jgi:hypothetical protein
VFLLSGSKPNQDHNDGHCDRNGDPLAGMKFFRHPLSVLRLDIIVD